MDTAGKVVIADDTASVLLGVPASTPAVDPTLRWNPGLPELIGAARYASPQAARNPDWVGSTQIFTHLADEPTPISIRPVFSSGHLIGQPGLVRRLRRGAAAASAGGAARPSAGQPRRVVATRDNRMVLLRLPEVSFAESEGNDVWLSTDQGRLRAASPSLDKLDGELADAGFLRVHRRYVVNLSRVREVERGRGASCPWSWTTGRTRWCRSPGGTRPPCAARWPSDFSSRRIPVSDSPDAVVAEVNVASAGGLGLPAPPAPAGRPSEARDGNRDWWPTRLDLHGPAQAPRRADPMGADFDYAAAFRTLDLDALAGDVDEVLTTSQEWWPADFGHYGPLVIRMVWHCAGTYRVDDGRGGAGRRACSASRR